MQAALASAAAGCLTAYLSASAREFVVSVRAQNFNESSGRWNCRLDLKNLVRTSQCRLMSIQSVPWRNDLACHGP